MKYLICLLISAPLWSTNLKAEIPSWAKENTIKKDGNILFVVCSGTGPSANLSKKSAINECVVLANQFLNSSIKVKSLSVETEYSVGLHHEVEDSGVVKNLVCEPQKDEVVEKDGSFESWIKCKFDLSKVIKEVEPEPKEKVPLVRSDLKSINVSTKTTHDQDGKDIFITVVPKCDSIIIQGERPRTIKCESNPLKVNILESDKVMIIRSTGYQSKEFNLKEGLNESIQVFLDKN